MDILNHIAKASPTKFGEEYKEILKKNFQDSISKIKDEYTSGLTGAKTDKES